MGLNTESAEVCDIFKKHIYYGRELDLAHVQEEIGDLLFYCAVLSRECGFSLEKAMKQNIKKLQKRYKGGYSNEKAIKRADKQEANDEVAIDRIFESWRVS